MSDSLKRCLTKDGWIAVSFIIVTLLSPIVLTIIWGFSFNYLIILINLGFPIFWFKTFPKLLLKTKVKTND